MPRVRHWLPDAGLFSWRRRPSHGYNCPGAHGVLTRSYWNCCLLGGDPDTRGRPREFAERGPIAREVLLNGLEAAVRRGDQVLASVGSSQLSEPRTYHGIVREIKGTTLTVNLP